jgi:RHS repeat-associated protein
MVGCETSSGTTNYLYDGIDISSNVIEEVDNAGNVLARYTHSPVIDQPLAAFHSGTNSYYQQDGLGSVTSLSNGNASLANTYAYDSYGKLTASSGTLVNPVQYTGREFDSETGIYEYRARYYDPSAGRFLSEDPIGFDGGTDFYAYAASNPANFIDPSGLAPCFDINNFVRTLDRNARDNPSTGWCGRAVGRALTAGGSNTGSHNGKDYGPYLLNNGFSTVPSSGYSPEAGDVAVIQPYPGGNQAGHVAGFDGTSWVSDHFQRGGTGESAMYPGRNYREFRPPYVIYRPNPCPTASTAEQSFFQRALTWARSLFQ